MPFKLLVIHNADLLQVYCALFPGFILSSREILFFLANLFFYVDKFRLMLSYTLYL